MEIMAKPYYQEKSGNNEENIHHANQKRASEVIALRDKFTMIPICPEVDGGLPTPRIPSERVGDKVLMKDGRDVTKNYNDGAMEALQKAQLYGCTATILKARSPSCGSGMVYDGSFTGKLIGGDGVTAELLKKNGIKVFSEENVLELEKYFDCPYLFFATYGLRLKENKDAKVSSLDVGLFSSYNQVSNALIVNTNPFGALPKSDSRYLNSK